MRQVAGDSQESTLRFNDTMREGSSKARGWLGFADQHTNKIRAQRRALIKAAGGIRQFKKQMRQARQQRAAANVIKTAAA